MSAEERAAFEAETRQKQALLRRRMQSAVWQGAVRGQQPLPPDDDLQLPERMPFAAARITFAFGGYYRAAIPIAVQ